ncbi:MAG: DUF2784 domain-containing protein [Burkholderiales bacterium]|nr:DUF2784 domain-containing protein [Burkholderiales bacterium]
MAADAVLIVHFAFVTFVVGGFALIWIGHFADWRWIGNRIFRSLHLAAITFVAIESLIGMVCPLTQWEDALRGRTEERSFIARGLHAILFYDLPEWLFTGLYVAFAVLTALTIRLVPMRPKAADPPTMRI